MPAIPIEHALAGAIAHHLAGRVQEAESLYRMILEAAPNHARARYNLALLCTSTGRPQDAIDAYCEAIAAQPDYVDAYINLAAIISGFGQREDAIALYRRALAISPHNALAAGNLGKLLQDLGRIEEAIATYRDAIVRAPDNGFVHANLGGALIELGVWDEAIAVTRRAIALEPDNAMAHANLARGLLHLGHYEESLLACHAAVRSSPQGAALHATLGGTMLELGALSEAEALCRRAVLIDPACAAGYFNLSQILKATNRLEEAASTARQSLAHRPDAMHDHYHLAHILLLQGDFEAGWIEFEWRDKPIDQAWFRAMHGRVWQTAWAGEDIHDKTILIYGEQGLGDIILFARWLPFVLQRAARVIVAAQPALRRVLETIKGIRFVSIMAAPLPAFDVHCALLSLPLIFACRIDTIPAAVPYLHAPPAEIARWATRITGKSLRVGIVWAGNPACNRDRFRSPGLRSVSRLFALPGISFVALQVGAGRGDPAHLPDAVIDLGAEVTDLADTAAILCGLDLMICSCTGPLHLAGALGVPSWAMIPFAPYFPWLLNAPTTPWYPSLRLYRQDRPGLDWSGVMARIEADLMILAETRSQANQALGFSR